MFGKLLIHLVLCLSFPGSIKAKNAFMCVFGRKGNFLEKNLFYVSVERKKYFFEIFNLLLVLLSIAYFKNASLVKIWHYDEWFVNYLDFITSNVKFLFLNYQGFNKTSVRFIGYKSKFFANVLLFRFPFLYFSFF